MEMASLSRLMDTVAQTSGAVVNLEDRAGITLEVPALKIRQDQHYHHGTYCMFAKLNGNQPACHQNKQRSIARAENSTEPFSGHCPYGVWDHAHPVAFDSTLVCIVYVGSLKGKAALRPLHGRPYQGPDLPLRTPQRIAACIRYAEYLATHIQLLLARWKLDGNKLGKKKPQEFYLEAAHQFIESNYTQDIGLQELAAQLGVHANYLGTVIQRLSDKKFGKHLQAYRIQRAKILLATGTMSVTQVAYSCGFNDSNYFSTIFKKESGLTPKAYRNQSL